MRKNKMMKIKRNNKKSGFSLAEIMIALVIVAILMAASAPLVNRRASIDNSFNCYWRSKSSQDNGIYFNDNGKGYVGIGISEPTTTAVLSLRATGDQSNNSIAFFNNDKSIVGKLGISGTNIFISKDNIDLGTSQNNVIIGNYDDSNGSSNILSIGGMNSLHPLLYGLFDNTSSNQILKVNGVLYTSRSSTTLPTVADLPTNYSLIAEDGILVQNSSDQVAILPESIRVTSNTSTMKCIIENDSIQLTNSDNTDDTSTAAISLDGLSGNISAGGTIRTTGDISTTAGNIYANSNGTTGGNITATGNISTTAGDIIAEGNGTTGGNISATGNINADNYIQTQTLRLKGITGGYGTISFSAANGLQFYGGSTYVNTQGLVSKMLDVTLNVGQIGSNLKLRIVDLIDDYMPVSDIRLKDVVGGTKYGLDQVRKMEIVEYKFKDEKKHGEGVRFGVIAQDLQKIMPESVVENKDGFLSIRQNNIFFVAINAIKQLDKEIQNIKQLLNLDEFKLDCGKLSSLKIVAQINKLKDENKELKNEIKLLKEQNANLEKRLDDIELMMLSK